MKSLSRSPLLKTAKSPARSQPLKALTADEIQEREEMCKDCFYRQDCKNGDVEYCELKDGGTPPADAVCYDISTGKAIPKDEDRDLYLTSDITRETTLPIIKQILEYNRKDNGIAPEDRIPIRLWINSDGGEEVSGSALMDVILASLTPVYAIGVGCVYSMATLIYLAAHKRYAFERSEFLIHDGSCESISSSMSKIYDQFDHFKRRNEKFRDFILESTGINADMYDFKARDEWYMFANEAKNYGIVNEIIGYDCCVEELYGL